MNKKTFIIVACILVIFLSVYLFTKNNDEDEKNIKYSFEQYKTAILDKNSSLAIKYLSQTTINYYADMLSLVKKGTKTEIQNRGLIDQMIILITRHMFDTETISKLNNGIDMLALSINHGLIGKEIVPGLSVSSIKVSGSIAFVEVRTEYGVAPQKFKFVKEDGIWKLDLTSIFPETNIILKSLVKDSGLTEEEFIFQILESQTGVKPDDTIWQPISF